MLERAAWPLPLRFQFVIAMIASAINERTRRKLDYALEENRILKEAFRAATGNERIRFTPDQRRRLALAGRELSPKERRQSLPDCEARDHPGLVSTVGRAQLRQLPTQDRAATQGAGHSEAGDRPGSGERGLGLYTKGHIVIGDDKQRPQGPREISVEYCGIHRGHRCVLAQLADGPGVEALKTVA